MKIFFGPAGLGSPALDGLDKCKELGLDAAEIEFTYGVRMTDAKAAQIGKKARSLGIRLSVHAPYYINLASKEKDKIIASKKRILTSCQRAHHLKATHVVFHAGFYQDRPEDKVYDMIKDNILDLKDTIKKKSWNVNLAPETTGKKSQFAGLDTLLSLKKDTGCSICIDFAHLFARNLGKIDYDEVFKKLRSLDHIHCHFSGINYTKKGEKSHKLLDKAFFDKLLSSIKKSKPRSITIINESPDTFGDAVKMKSWYENS